MRRANGLMDVTHIVQRDEIRPGPWASVPIVRMRQAAIALLPDCFEPRRTPK
jgi:hypothetical protein